MGPKRSEEEVEHGRNSVGRRRTPAQTEGVPRGTLVASPACCSWSLCRSAENSRRKRWTPNVELPPFAMPGSGALWPATFAVSGRAVPDFERNFPRQAKVIHSRFQQHITPRPLSFRPQRSTILLNRRQHVGCRRSGRSRRFPGSPQDGTKWRRPIPSAIICLQREARPEGMAIEVEGLETKARLASIVTEVAVMPWRNRSRRSCSTLTTMDRHASSVPCPDQFMRRGGWGDRRLDMARRRHAQGQPPKAGQCP